MTAKPQVINSICAGISKSLYSFSTRSGLRPQGCFFVWSIGDHRISMASVFLSGLRVLCVEKQNETAEVEKNDVNYNNFFPPIQYGRAVAKVGKGIEKGTESAWARKNLQKNLAVSRFCRTFAPAKRKTGA